MYYVHFISVWNVQPCAEGGSVSRQQQSHQTSPFADSSMMSCLAIGFHFQVGDSNEGSKVVFIAVIHIMSVSIESLLLRVVLVAGGDVLLLQAPPNSMLT